MTALSRLRDMFTGRVGTPLDDRAESVEQLTARIGRSADPAAPPTRPLGEIEQDFLKKYQADNLAAASARVVEAEVRSVGPEWIELDLSGASGVMPVSDLCGAPSRLGDTIKVAVVPGAAGRLMLSARLAAGHAGLLQLKAGSASDLMVEGIYSRDETASSGSVYGVADISGYWGLVADARPAGLVPSASSLMFGIDLFDAARGLLILSRTKYLNSRRSERSRMSRARLKPGDVCDAIFQRIERGDGLFDIDGVPAVMPAQDAAHAYPQGFFRTLTPGRTVRVMVLKNDPGGELIIGRRQLIPDPWLLSKKMLAPGARVSGVIAEVTAERLWVELQPGLAGDVAWKEAGWGLTRPEELALRFRAGDAVEAVILQCSVDQNRLTLSLRQARPNPAIEWLKQFERGSPVTVRAMDVHDSGVDVVSSNGEWGFVRAEDLSWDGPSSPRVWPRSGQPFETVFLGVDAATKRLLFGRKQLTPDLFAAAASGLASGQVVSGKAVKKIEAGILVEISRGVVGLVHKSEIPAEGAAIQPGDSLDVQILEIQLEARRISLSWARVVEERERRKTAEFLQDARGGAPTRTVRMDDLVGSDVFQKFLKNAPAAPGGRGTGGAGGADPAASSGRGTGGAVGADPAAPDSPSPKAQEPPAVKIAPREARPVEPLPGKTRTVKMDELIDSDLLKKFLPREGK